MKPATIVCIIISLWMAWAAITAYCIGWWFPLMILAAILAGGAIAMWKWIVFNFCCVLWLIVPEDTNAKAWKRWQKYLERQKRLIKSI